VRILVVTPYAIFPPWFNTDLEMIQTHLDAGDDVACLACNAHLPVCDFNEKHDLQVCLHCVGRRVEGFRLLRGNVRVLPVLDLTAQQRAELARLPLDFADLDALKSWSVDNFDIGWAIVASVLWLTRDPYPDLNVHAALIRDLAYSSLAVYRSVENHLAAAAYDRVYVFGGKHGVPRAVLRACQKQGVPCYVTERGNSIHTYEAYPDVMPHDMAYNVRAIQEAWNHAANNPQREAIASRFYEEKAQGVTQAWYSFTKDQQQGALPANWDVAKRNIVIFSTSLDEFGSVGEDFVGPLYRDPLTGLHKIIASLTPHQERLHLYLRIHPNLAGVHNPYEDQIRDLRAPFLTVIQPEGRTSSYPLMQAATTVLTFGSTTGIEAAYWGKPSVLAGMNYYRNLGSTYNPASHEELIELLLQDLPAKDRTGALMYGYYYMTYGKPFRFFVPDDPLNGKFQGQYVRANKWLARAGNMLKRLPSVHSWLSRLSHRWRRGRRADYREASKR
jgi:hypothetical protein